MDRVKLNAPLRYSEVACNSCVYVFFRTDGVPAYVGVGDESGRFKQHSTKSHNIELANIMKAAGGSLPFVVIRSDISKEGAFAVEVALIHVIGRADLKLGPLLNRTNGGDGVHGHGPESRLLMRLAKVGKKRDPEHVFKAAQASAIARKGKPVPRTREIRLQEFADPDNPRRAALTGFWVTDGQVNKRIPPDSQIPDGWSRGRSGNYKEKIRQTLGEHYAQMTPEERKALTANAVKAGNGAKPGVPWSPGRRAAQEKKYPPILLSELWPDQ